MYDAADSLVLMDMEVVEIGDRCGQGPQRSGLPEGAVRPMCVVVELSGASGHGAVTIAASLNAATIVAMVPAELASSSKWKQGGGRAFMAPMWAECIQFVGR